jgi:hypothetical protein
MVSCNLDVEFDTRQASDITALAEETFGVRQSVSCRINLLGLLLDVVKKADQ